MKKILLIIICISGLWGCKQTIPFPKGLEESSFPKKTCNVKYYTLIVNVFNPVNIKDSLSAIIAPIPDLEKKVLYIPECLIRRLDLPYAPVQKLETGPLNSFKFFEFFTGTTYFTQTQSYLKKVAAIPIKMEMKYPRALYSAGQYRDDALIFDEGTKLGSFRNNMLACLRQSNTLIISYKPNEYYFEPDENIKNKELKDILKLEKKNNKVFISKSRKSEKNDLRTEQSVKKHIVYKFSSAADKKIIKAEKSYFHKSN